MRHRDMKGRLRKEEINKIWTCKGVKLLQRKWNIVYKNVHDQWTPKRNLNKWNRYKISKHKREYFIKQRSIYVLWLKGHSVPPKLVQNYQPKHIHHTSCASVIIDYPQHPVPLLFLSPSLLQNKQIREILRSYLKKWKKNLSGFKIL